MTAIIVLLVVLSVLVCIASAAKVLNDYPIIGVFTQPSSSKQGNCGGKCLYLAASYVKYLEAAGARVVPINYYATNAELDHLFESLNGFFFPGGGAAYPASAQYVFDKTKAANDAGDFAPLWGTCMGFQWLLIAASKDQNVLDPSDGTVLDSYNYSIPLDFTTAAKSSRLFASAPASAMEILATQNVTMNNHHYGIFTSHFQSTSSLSTFYDMLSTNKDKKGVEFVSTIEAFNYPIYGTQWHPEKNPFEWAINYADGFPAEGINHSPEAIFIAQYTADFYVQQARKSTHKFADYNEQDARLIWNYPVTKTTDDFVQTYFLATNF